MKIILTGKPWWIGAVIKCPACGTQYELEQGDKPQFNDLSGVTCCPTCALTNTFYRDEKLNKP